MSVSYSCYVIVGIPVKGVEKPIQIKRYNEKTGEPVMKEHIQKSLKLGDTEITECSCSEDLAEVLEMEFLSYYYGGNDGIIGIIIERITDEEGLVELTGDKVTEMTSFCQNILDDELVDNKEVAKVYLMKVAG